MQDKQDGFTIGTDEDGFGWDGVGIDKVHCKAGWIGSGSARIDGRSPTDH